MPQTILGIDIGSYSVKIAQIERSFKSFEFVRFYERRIGYNELLTPEESLTVTLQGMIEDFGLRWDTVICGFPTLQVSSRSITLPFGSLNKIDQTFEYELEGMIPFELSEIVSDYHLLSSSKEGSHLLVFFSERKEVTKWLQMLGNAGIDPKILSLDASQLIHVMALGIVPPEGLYAVVDVGHVKTNVALARGKKLGFVRAISLGGKQITEEIQKRLKISFEEAEKMKVDMGGLSSGADMPDDVTRQVTWAIRSKIDELILYLRQVLFAYQDREGEAVTGLYLCGGSSRIPGLDRYLSERLKQNITFLDPTSFHFSRLTQAGSHRVVMPTALGLALRGVATPGLPDINFRRGDFAFRGDVEKLGGTLRHIGIVAGLVMAMGLAHFGFKYFTLSSQVQRVHNEIAEMAKEVLPEVSSETLTSPTQALSLIRAEGKKIQDRVTKLEHEFGLGALKVVQEISQKSPGREEVKLDVEDLQIMPDRVRLAGRADSFVSVDKIKAALSTSGMFKSVTTGNVRKGIKDEVKFDLSMELVRR